MDLRLPEIRRRWDAECTAPRLALGAVTSLIVGASLFALTLELGADKFDCYAYCKRAAMLLLLGYGSVRVAASVSEERRQGTWDLLRLTPLSSFEVSLGKLLGAPVYPAVLAAALIPWLVLSAHLSPEAAWPRVLPSLVEFACMTFGGWALALMISAMADERLGNSEGTRFILLVLLAPLVFATTGRLVKIVFPPGRLSYVILQTCGYYGATIPCWIFDSLSWLVFGSWAFEAARWRIGVDKLEVQRPWRITAFMLFLVLYVSGLPSGGPQIVILFPYLAFLLASLAEPWSAGQWRRWRSNSGVRLLTRAPVWMRGAATFAVLAAACSLASFGAAPAVALEARRFPLLLGLFALRDVLFLQWCRLKVRRNPEVVAVVYLALAYAVPAMLLGLVREGRMSFLFSAAARGDLGLFVNLLPALLQAGLAAYALAGALPQGPKK